MPLPRPSHDPSQVTFPELPFAGVRVALEVCKEVAVAMLFGSLPWSCHRRGDSASETRRIAVQESRCHLSHSGYLVAVLG